MVVRAVQDTQPGLCWALSSAQLLLTPLLPSVLCFGFWPLTLPLFLFKNMVPTDSGAFDDTQRPVTLRKAVSCPSLSLSSFSHLPD